MKYYPIFNENKLSFMREEKKGCWLIRLKEFPELQDLIINHITKEIFNYCTGKNDVEAIINKMQQKYITTNITTIRNDVGLILSKFSHLGVVSWGNKNDPYLVVNERLFENNYKIRCAVESDYMTVYNYIYKNHSNFFKFAEYYNQSYTDLSVRAKIFYGMEDFYILFDQNEQIVCMVGLEKKDCRNIYKDVRMTFISDIKNSENVIFLISYVKSCVQDFTYPKPRKLRAVLFEKNNSIIKNILCYCDFKWEAKFDDEIDENSVLVYSVLLP